MSNVNEILLKAYVKSQAEYNPDALIGKSREELMAEINELSDYELIEIIDSAATKVVHEEFEDAGRWSNYRTIVYELWLRLDGIFEKVYLSVTREVPATELQEGGDFMEPEIERVYPHKIETVVYKPFPQEKE